MHGTACAPGYPSDSTRSLAGVGPLGELLVAACATTARGQRGRRSDSYAQRASLAGWAGAGRGPQARRLLQLVPTLHPTSPPPRSRRRHLRRGGSGPLDTLPAATLLLRRHTRPPWGRCWSRSAGKSWVRGGTPRDHPLSHSGRRRAVLTSRWPWASDGPSAEQRIVGSHRHWRPGDAQWGRVEPLLPLADRRRRRIPSGPGGSAARPACAPSAGRAQ